MKLYIILILSLSLSCKSSKQSDIQHKVEGKVSQQLTTCPENGNCTIELLPKKSLIFKKDAFGILYHIIEEGEKTILRFTYKKQGQPNVQDSNYSEIILAELPEIIQNTSLSQEQLDQVKLHFGRFCFCKGETGFYPVRRGIFKLTSLSKNTINITIEFSIKEVPQIISNINETISLKSNETN